MKYFKKTSAILLTTLLLGSTIHPNAFANTSEAGMEEVIITFTSDVIDQHLISFIQDNQGIITMKPEEIRSISAIIPSTLFDDIASYPTVRWIEKDQKLNIAAQVKDWGVDETKTPSAWNFGYTGKGVKIAVFDSGISEHSDLQVKGGISKVSYTTSYKDDHGHGSHVAGIIGAKNNNFGTVGVAPDAELYAVKVADTRGTAFTSDIISGIDWAIANDMDIINMSLGMEYDSYALKDAVVRATKEDILVVAAAGNDGDEDLAGDTVDYPAKYDEVIAVSAIDKLYQRASFSSAGPAVDVAAPGVNIISTYLNDKYAYMSGTSMASPYVAGILALFKEAYPTYNAKELEAIVKVSALDLGKSGNDDIFGMGFVQAPPIKNVTTETLKVFDFKVNATQSKIYWNTVQHATSYELKRDENMIYKGSMHFFHDPSLIAGTTYTYKLTAKNNDQVIDVLSKKVITLPDFPTNLKETHTATTAKLTWNTVKGATYYEVKNNELGKVIYKGTNPYLVFPSLVSGKTYHFTVYAGNQNGVSTGSKISLTTTLLVPEKPVLKTSKATQTSNQLSWSALRGTSYEVKRNDKRIYQGANATFTDKNLSAGTTYTYTITAKNKVGTSAVFTVKKATLPNTPVNLKGKNSKTSNTLTWNSVKGATYYIVKSNGKQIYKGSSLSYVHKNLLPGATYSYVVYAGNTSGVSPASKTIKVITAQSVPKTPVLAKISTTQTGVTLSWQSIHNAKTYIVKRNGTVVYQGTKTSFTDKNLKAGTTYTYSVAAKNEKGTSAYTTIKKQTIPANVTNLKVTSTKNSNTVSWKGVTGATYYEVKVANQVVYKGTATKFTHKGLQAGRTYNYLVSTGNASGTSKTLPIKGITKMP